MPGKRSRLYTADDVRFVRENYAIMTASQIAEKLGISKFQVSKIVNELRQYIDLPKKTATRINPILQYLEQEGIKPTPITREKKQKPTKKKTA